MEYGFVGQLYKIMRAGDTRSFRRMLRNNPKSALNKPADGCVAPVLISAVVVGRVEYLEELLAAGADPNIRDDSTKGAAHNMCALHAALEFERSDMAELLRAKGARDDFGTAVFGRDTRKVRSALIKDPSQISSAYIRSTFTLLHVAAVLGHEGLTRLFLEKGVDPNQRDGDGHAPLRFAARNAEAMGLLEALVGAGAEVNAASKTGITALSEACRGNDTLNGVIWLLEQGADPNLVPKDHNSPLLRATRLKNTKMVRALLEAGANVEFEGKKGETARKIAEQKKAEAILNLLRRALPLTD